MGCHFHLFYIVLVFILEYVCTQPGINGVNPGMNGPFYTPHYKDVKINPDQMKAVVKVFGDKMNQMVYDFTSYKFLEQKYDKYFQHFIKLDGRSLVNEVANDIGRMLKKKIKAVEELVEVAEKENIKSHYEETIDLDYLNNKKLLSDDDLQAMNETVENAMKTYKYIHLVQDKKYNDEMINYNLSTIHVPTNVFDKAPEIQNGVNWTHTLDGQFQKNHNTDQSSKWQYFCSSDGFFRIYPGIKWPKNNTDGRIDTFDCRMRSWYIKAATTPKNIIILIDSSGSMKGLRMKITHFTVDKILQTLSDEDHFQIIDFAKETSYVDKGCSNGTLIHASEQNKRRMLEKVKEIKPSQKANFTKALIEAFELFEEVESNLSNNSEQSKQTKQTENPKLCNKALMLITDGAPESYEKVFQEYNWPSNKSVRVFTFLIGREVSESRNAKWMADANRGYYTHISTLADVQENVQEYIKVMSRPLAFSRTKNHIWTSLYADYITEVSDNKDRGLQYIVSFAAPVYDLKGYYNESKLLGVAGTDVTVQQIQDLIPYNRLGPNAYAFVVTHQGYVLFHPNFQPTFLKQDPEDGFNPNPAKIQELHPNFQNVDITDVEYSQDDELLQQMRTKLLLGKKREPITLTLKVPYDEDSNCPEFGKKRIAVRNYTFYYSKIAETEFSLGIALAQKRVPSISYRTDMNKSRKKDGHTELATWRYCKHEWTDFNELQDFLVNKFSDNGNNKKSGGGKKSKGEAKGCSEYSDSYLQWDWSITSDILDEWTKRAREQVSSSSYDTRVKPKEVYKSFGVEQVFLWTSAGLTKYVTASANLTEPNFIKENRNTVKNKHYRQTVEGLEYGYNYTYSVPYHAELYTHPKNLVITITAPIYKQKFTMLVVGLQMKYLSFTQRMEEVIENMSVPQTNPDSSLSCKDKAQITCYILDSNGYIIYSNMDDENMTSAGKLLEDQSLMQELIDNGFYKQEKYLNQQVMCKKELQKDGENSAAFLLNPFKQFANLIFWMFTETVIFLYEWSWFTEDYSVYAQAPKKHTCFLFKDLQETSKFSTLPRSYQHHLLQTVPICPMMDIPCARYQTRNRMNFNKLKRYKHNPFVSSTSDCKYCADPADCMPQCNRSYTVQWIDDTNLMFVAAASPVRCIKCLSEKLGPPSDMNTEKIYTEEETCDTLLNKSVLIKTRDECIDSHESEPELESGQARNSFSYVILALTFVLCLTANQKSV
ncbi:voltage-dependent calcium channel subunit alpha-2/delta-3-like isoform X1 [Mytilus edulis]|uniref:voltage-dependent calcium channel subunit alpha-2/delta-3-like isoform X1 n=1 Tax=Mytilus edulis TaxID=6550 RepID=UPI0039EF3D66